MNNPDTLQDNFSTSDPQEGRKRVVVLGSGYAGIHACRTLIKQARPDDDLELVLLSDADHLLYVTMIYEVAAGNLAPASIRQSVRTMLNADNASFRQGRAVAVDFTNQTVQYDPVDARTEDNQHGPLTLSYDYLVSAIGSETNFFGTPGAEEYAHKLKKLSDARQLKNTLINNFERATLITDEQKRRQLLSVAIVGGGPTGVTLAAKIADLFNHELADAFPDLIDEASITVIEGGDQLVAPAGPWFSRNVTETLRSLPRVNLITGSCAQEVRPDGLVYGDGEFLPSRCVVWTAGVKAREFDIAETNTVKIDEQSRRLHVTPQLHLPEYENAFVAGDQAWVERIDSEQPYPMRAQFAVRQGRQAARNILASIRDKPLTAFDWEDKGIVISVGHGRTYASVFGIKMSGLPATLAYKSIYLLSTIGVRAKLRAILEWTINLFRPRDISEL